MVISVGDQVNWIDLLEPCENGICVGEVVIVAETNTKYPVVVNWTVMCAIHQIVDPNGVGPYKLASLAKTEQS